MHIQQCLAGVLWTPLSFAELYTKDYVEVLATGTCPRPLQCEVTSSARRRLAGVGWQHHMHLARCDACGESGACLHELHVAYTVAVVWKHQVTCPCRSTGSTHEAPSGWLAVCRGKQFGPKNSVSRNSGVFSEDFSTKHP